MGCLITSPARGQSTQAADRPAAPVSALSGYMELQFVDPSNADAFIDFRRFVLLFAHRFSDRIRFVSELEVEHALVEGGEDKGELELEQAYLDFLIDRRFSIRAGQLLVPVGIINERHEPPVYYGVHARSSTPSSSRRPGSTWARVCSATSEKAGAIART